MEKYLLENGLVIYYYHIPHAYSTSIGLYIRAGSRFESSNNRGITHLLEHMHFRQLGNLDGKGLTLAMQKMGVTFNATTYADYVRFFMKFRPEHLNSAIPFFVDLIETTAWTEDQLEAEKKVVINQILERGEEDFDDLVRKSIWKSNALSQRIAGTVNSVKNITLKQLVAYKRHLFTKNNMALCVTGDFSEKEVMDINQLCSAIPLSDHGKPFSCKRPLLNCRKPDVKLINWGGDYLDINWSFDVNLELASNEELTLLNSILGGGDGSILVNEIRERLGLSANIFSEMTFYRDAAVLSLSFNVLKKDLKSSLTSIITLLKQMKVCIGDDDMKASLPFYTSNLWYFMEDPELFNNFLMWQIFVRELPEYTIEHKISLFESITAKRLADISDTLFRAHNATIVIAGNLDRITSKSICEILLQLDT